FGATRPGPHSAEGAACASQRPSRGQRVPEALRLRGDLVRRRTRRPCSKLWCPIHPRRGGTDRSAPSRLPIVDVDNPLRPLLGLPAPAAASCPSPGPGPPLAYSGERTPELRCG